MRYNELFRKRISVFTLPILLAYIPLKAIEIIIVLGIIIILLFAYIVYLHIKSCVANKIEVLRLKQIVEERKRKKERDESLNEETK